MVQTDRRADMEGSETKLFNCVLRTRFSCTNHPGFVKFWTIDGNICNCCSVQKRSNLNLLDLLVFRELHGLNPPNTKYYITKFRKRKQPKHL